MGGARPHGARWGGRAASVPRGPPAPRDGAEERASPRRPAKSRPPHARRPAAVTYPASPAPVGVQSFAGAVPRSGAERSRRGGGAGAEVRRRGGAGGRRGWGGCSAAARLVIQVAGWRRSDTASRRLRARTRSPARRLAALRQRALRRHRRRAAGRGRASGRGRDGPAAAALGRPSPPQLRPRQASGAGSGSHPFSAGEEGAARHHHLHQRCPALVTTRSVMVTPAPTWLRSTSSGSPAGEVPLQK